MDRNDDAMVRVGGEPPALLHPLALATPLPPDKHPAAVYLRSLVSPASRSTMRRALNLVAGLLTGGRCNAETLAWARLDYQHTAAVRSALLEHYSPASVNQALAALRGVLKEAWRL
jgi:hypothetical protein